MPVYKDHSFRLGASAQGDDVYTISQSLRFDASATVNLIASSLGAGDTRKKNTFSVWIKRGRISDQQYIGAYRYDATNYQYWLFKADNRLEFTDVSGGSVIGKLITTQIFADPTAWYNLTFVWDTANTISTDRMKIFVNGERVSALDTATYPSASVDSGGAGRASGAFRVGTYDATGAFFDGHMTNIVYVDNSALGAGSFGEFNDSGIWIPKDVSDLTFGTRGFYIDGRDASDLGDDESGNGNDFGSGLAAHDQSLDTPNNNWCTMNGAAKHTDSGFVLAQGGLELTRTAANNKGIVATVGLTSGKWYWEVRTIHGTSYNIEHGVIGEINQGTILTGTDVSIGSSSSGYSLQFNTNDYYKRHDNSSTDTTINATSPSFQAIALDMDNKKIWFGYAVDGASSITWFESGNPAGGSNHIYALDDGNTTYYPCHNSSRGNGTQQARFNFGQDGSFAGEETATYTDSNGLGNFFFEPPSGFLAICTRNLFTG